MSMLGQIATGISGGSGNGQNSSINDQYAASTRQQWSDYVGTFIPIENQLIKYATDPNQVSQAMQKADQNVNAAFTQQAGATARRLTGLGVTLSPDEQAAQQRQTGLGRALADVQGQNIAGDMTRQRQQSILGNPAPPGA